MAKANIALYAFNRGLISPLALARVDLGRVALSAERMSNWMPRSLGSMMLRPGFRYLGTTNASAYALFLPFVFATADTALVEVAETGIRVWVDDEVVTRVAVNTAVSNGEFTTDLTGWTDNDAVGATSAWAAGRLSLIGTDFVAASRYQELAVAPGDLNKEHALRIKIWRGPVVFRAGSTLGEDNYIRETVLGAGTHSLAFTPTGSQVFIEFEGYTQYATLIDSVSIEAAGAMVLDSPWDEEDLKLVRYDQSGDVLFIAADGYQQRRIERRSTNSWSIITYEANDGPLLLENVGPVTITPSDTDGDITLTASDHLFQSTHVGGVFSLTSTGQFVEETFSGEDQFTDPIRVIGVDAQRAFTIIRTSLTGTGTTLTLQRSIAEPGAWVDVSNFTTSTAGQSFDDGLDNQIIFYRIGVKTGNYSSGTPVASLTYTSGGITGFVRIKGFTSATSVMAIVLKSLGGTGATSIWAEGAWSDFRGFPTAALFYEGRLWWAGRGQFLGSVVDAYHSFDIDTEGDSGPIIRSVGFGPVDKIHWMIGLQRLLGGAEGSELSVRSSNDNEPLTPTNFAIKDSSTQGAAAVPAAKVDSSAVFIQRSGSRAYELAYAFEPNDYSSRDLTIHVPNIGLPSLDRTAVQRQPDTRIHFVRGDGKALICLFNKAEDLLCWVIVETDGFIEEVITLPSLGEDTVYYVVRRVVDGNTVRYLEKWAQETDCAIWSTTYDGDSATVLDLADAETAEVYLDGTVLTARDANGDKIENVTVANGAVTLSAAVEYAHLTPAACHHADSYVFYDGVATTSITGLDHLEGETVVVWADGKDHGTFTVASGAITLTESVQVAIVGLGYTGRYRSTKLAYADQAGSALTQVKRVTALGIIAAYTHYDGLQYGAKFSDMYDLPQVVNGADVADDNVHSVYDQRMVMFPGEYDTDARVCLKAAAPRPATVLAAVIGMETIDEL